MAEMNLYFAKKDEDEFVRFVLESGAEMVPSVHYETPQYVVITSEKLFQRYRRRTQLFFILKQTYLRCALELASFEKKGKRIYYVSQRNAGPTIDYLKSVLFCESRRLHIGMGSISHHPTYWNPIAEAMEKPPKELLDFYKSLQNYVKREAVKIKAATATYWVGKCAVEAVKRGAVLDGFPKTGSSSLVQV
jgi:hypothetical protein